MKTHTKSFIKPARKFNQHGVVLFFALVALLAISLAAVALVRSVDTNTMIAGNLAFRQSATSSGDAGIEAGMTWLDTTEAATALNVVSDPTHPFNVDQATLGYYASANSAVSLTATTGTRIKWDDDDSSDEITDPSGNATRYVIQRMCRTSGVAAENAGCLMDTTTKPDGPNIIPLGSDICEVPPCETATQNTFQYRITIRSKAPRNSVSYVQGFVY